MCHRGSFVFRFGYHYTAEKPTPLWFHRHPFTFDTKRVPTVIIIPLSLQGLFQSHTRFMFLQSEWIFFSTLIFPPFSKVGLAQWQYLKKAKNLNHRFIRGTLWQTYGFFLWDHSGPSVLYVASEEGLFSQDLYQRAGLWWDKWAGCSACRMKRIGKRGRAMRGLF